MYTYAVYNVYVNIMCIYVCVIHTIYVIYCAIYMQYM